MICLRIDGLGRLSSFLRQPVGYNTVYFFLRERPAAARIPILILRVGVGGLLLGVLVHSFFAHGLVMEKPLTCRKSHSAAISIAFRMT